MTIFCFLLLVSWLQTDWSGGGGQPSWIDSTKYFNRSHINHSKMSGSILLNAPNGWVNTGELPTNHIWALVETHDSVIYVGGDSTASKGFVFKSEDYGNTWVNTNILSCSWVHSLLESHADTLYAGTSVGVLKYTGTNWVSTLSEQINVLIETKDSIFYAGTWNGEIWKSSDGNSWNKLTVNNGVRIWDMIEISDTLYASGTRDIKSNDFSGIFKSGDGMIFDTITFPHIDRVVYSLLLANDSTIYAGTGPDSGKVFKTQDGGNIWDTTQSLEYANSIYSLLQGDGAIYAGTGSLAGYLYKSTNGQSWSFEDIDATISTIYSLFQASNGFLYAGTNKGIGSGTSVWRAGYFPTGYLKSSSFEASVTNELNYDSVFWDVELNGGAIEVWVRTNTEPDMFGMDSFELSHSGDTIPDAFDGKGYIQYQVKFSSPSQYSTPIFKYIGINYFPISGAKENAQCKTQNIKLEIYPNPFIRKTIIRYSLNKSQTIHNSQLTIHDIAGRLIQKFPISDSQSPNHEITWDAKEISAGIYFAKFKADDYEDTKKLIILK